MNVNLKIENDAELRAYIKDCIKGQVLSIVREEILEIVKTELTRKINAMNTRSSFDEMIFKATQKAISDILYSENDVKMWDFKFVSRHVLEEITRYISGKDLATWVDSIAKDKIKALIK